MSTILIVDDMAIFRDPIAASLRLAGYDTAAASNGKEALALIANKRPDLILLDLAMPIMDGMTMLAALRRMPGGEKIPVILLTASAEKRLVVQAAQLGVGDYLLKSRFSLTELLARVKRHLHPKAQAPPAEAVAPGVKPSVATTEISKLPPAAASREALDIPKLLTRDQCLQRAEDAMDARSLSGVAAQVIAMAASPRGDLEELAGLIGRDPALSARVLQAANSAAYLSKRGPVTNITDAVRQVGCSTVRNIASTVGIYEAMPASSASASPDFNPIRSWQHSFAVATLCEQLCLSARPELGGTAHIVGLCHDLGEILFRTHFAEEYKQVLKVRERTGQPLQYLERQILGMPHGELVRTITRKMGLPDVIRVAIETFHGEDSESSTDPLVRITRVAEAYANGLGLASSGLSLVRPLTRNECRAATGLEKPSSPDSQQFRAEIYALTAMLARLSLAQEKELMVPLHPRGTARVWLAREAGFTSFDPVAAALEVLAGEVTVQDRLPATAAELADHTAIAVLTRTPAVNRLLAADIDRAASLGPQKLPVLWLCTRPEGAPPTPVAPISAAITLDRLVAFLGTPAASASPAIAA
ncbi:MAG TPA: HDOD domain-containing protein [Tepidisphaeraceae bacterium]|nr:HDOD domain-containing protein [Tepidisphaeraceae bacterium]